MNVFDTVLVKKPKKSKFNLSHEVKTTTFAGTLTPFLCTEVLPNENFKISTEAFIKAAPLVAPLMHRVNLKIEYWYVPNRIIFPKWDKYINPVTPQDEALRLPHFRFVPKECMFTGTLWDYLGLPSITGTRDLTLEENSCGINALPFLAYQMIYNEFYRDPNMQSVVELPHEVNPLYDGDIGRVFEIRSEQYKSLLDLRRRCWEKDYFTTAQPDVQRGDDVMLNMSGEATFNLEIPSLVNSPRTMGASDSRVPLPNGGYIEANGTGDFFEVFDANGVSQGGFTSYTKAQEVAYRTQIEMESGISINDLRELNTLQKYKEKLQLAGTRYKDWLLTFFGITSQDSRLQRPQFLGGGRVPLSVGETFQTSETTTASPQGTQSGNFFGLSQTPYAKFYVPEHGYIIGILSVIPRTSYYQGVPRHFTKFDRFDFALPMFANLGEQDVKRTEIFAGDASQLMYYLRNTERGGLFGYQQRYAEYKYIPSTVHGAFRDSLESWQWSRKFENMPQLGSDFLECRPDSRPFAVEGASTEQFYIQLYNHVTAIRPLPRIAQPKL